MESNSVVLSAVSAVVVQSRVKVEVIELFNKSLIVNCWFGVEGGLCKGAFSTPLLRRLLNALWGFYGGFGIVSEEYLRSTPRPGFAVRGGHVRSGAISFMENINSTCVPIWRCS